LINPTRPGEYNLTPFTGPNPADPPTLTPDLQTTQNPGTTDTPNPGALPDLGTEARALIITPDGHPHTPTPTPAPTARALTDPTHPHTGAPRKRGPDTWNAPTPHEFYALGARPTDQQLQQFAQMARQAGVSNGGVFAAGLAAAGWMDLGQGYARAWAAWNAVPPPAPAEPSAEVPAWVTRPPLHGTTPDDEQLKEFARAARQARVSSGKVFVAGLTAAGWGGLGTKYARAWDAWRPVTEADPAAAPAAPPAAAPAAAPAAPPAWTTLPPEHDATPTDQQLRDFARAAREARVRNRDDFVAGLAAAGWRELGHRSVRAREAWNAVPEAAPAAPAEVPAWVTLPPRRGARPTDQQLEEFARAARQAGVRNGYGFAADLIRAGWRDLGNGYTRARGVWNAVPAAAPAEVPAWVTLPPQRRAKPTDQQLREFARAAREAGVSDGKVFEAGLAAAGWGGLGTRYAKAWAAWNAVKKEVPLGHGATPTDRQGEVIMPDRPPRPGTAFSPP
ncbi:hypothetical protein, partial [Actinoallomurus sp. NPDC050550]|uniref:hypothetical protein n=1 Tax=Actinoallomurus sp. NPDC050550 TaxID=3154937 RepID=UPI0033DC519B